MMMKEIKKNLKNNLRNFPFEFQELECQVLQSLLFCMHAFLTAKVASVDPAFLSSIHQS